MPGGGKKGLGEKGTDGYKMSYEEFKELELMFIGGISVVGQSGKVIFNWKVKNDGEETDSLYCMFIARWDEMTEKEKGDISRVLEHLIELCRIMDVPVFDYDQMISAALRAGMRPDGEYIRFYALDHASPRMIPKMMRMVMEEDFERVFGKDDAEKILKYSKEMRKKSRELSSEDQRVG